jgi:uncharacterized protein (TIGR02001 family)
MTIDRRDGFGCDLQAGRHLLFRVESIMKAHKNFRALAGLAGIALTLSAQAAKAEDAAAPKEFTVTGSAALVSDYRLRGVSQSDRGKALQAGVTVTHKSGFYGSLWSSTWPVGARLAVRTSNST